MKLKWNILYSHNWTASAIHIFTNINGKMSFKYNTWNFPYFHTFSYSHNAVNIRSPNITIRRHRKVYFYATGEKRVASKNYYLLEKKKKGNLIFRIIHYICRDACLGWGNHLRRGQHEFCQSRIGTHANKTVFYLFGLSFPTYFVSAWNFRCSLFRLILSILFF